MFSFIKNLFGPATDYNALLENTIQTMKLSHVDAEGVVVGELINLKNRAV